MYTVKNNQNLDFTGSNKTNPYALIQQGGKRRRRKSRKTRKSRSKTRKSKRT